MDPGRIGWRFGSGDGGSVYRGVRDLGRGYR